MTHVDILSAYGDKQSKDRKAVPISLLIAVIKEKPKASEAIHKAAFVRLVRQPGYEEYLASCLNRIANMDYPAAVQAAFPPTRKEIDKKVADRKAGAAKMAEKVKTTVTRRILSLDFTIDGKKLRDMTFAECAKLGGIFLAISKKGKPNQRVGDILTDVDLQQLR